MIFWWELERSKCSLSGAQLLGVIFLTFSEKVEILAFSWMKPNIVQQRVLFPLKYVCGVWGFFCKYFCNYLNSWVKPRSTMGKKKLNGILHTVSRFKSWPSQELLFIISVPLQSQWVFIILFGAGEDLLADWWNVQVWPRMSSCSSQGKAQHHFGSRCKNIYELPMLVTQTLFRSSLK